MTDLTYKQNTTELIKSLNASKIKGYIELDLYNLSLYFTKNWKNTMYEWKDQIKYIQCRYHNQQIP